MWRVEWTARAIRNVGDIRIYIAFDNPDAAARLAGRLVAAGDGLSQYPRRGRPVGRGVRQLSSVYPYLIRYRIRQDFVEIISVRHGARR